MSLHAISQNDSKMYGWRLNSINGEVDADGHYREMQRIGSGIDEYLKSSYLSGGLILRTQSTILHPNFLTLNIDAGYVPETRRDNYLVIPDQSEISTLKKLGGITASFFKHKDVSLNLFGNYDQSYSSRENLTSIRSTDKRWGAAFGYNNKILPFTVEFHNKKWEEEEIENSRTYKMDQKQFVGRASKSFSKRDRNELSFSHDNTVSINQNQLSITNRTDNLDLVSYINLDAGQKYKLTTMISDYIQQGNLNMKRVQASENITLLLPFSLSFNGNYNYYNIHQNSYTLNQNSVSTSLAHQLFKSLQSRLNIDFNSINHSVYGESNTKTGVEFNYTKAIPGGQLLIAYKYDRYHQKYSSDPVSLQISNEQYTLSDSKITLLRLPDIELSSIIVKDITGTLIYQAGVDYILIDRGRYFEIRRIPGGSINNDVAVLIDYQANQPGKYQYNANAHVLSANLYLFNNLLSFSYRFSTQDYFNLESTEFITLNYYTQHVLGCRVEYKFISAGAEYEDYKSTILPYRMSRYYLNFQKSLGMKVMLMLNGNFQDYTMLSDTSSRNQKYSDITGKLTYNILRQTNLNFDLMYRKQTGRGIDLDLLTSKAEITSTINRLNLSVGFELYRRNYVGEKINFKGTYFKIVRKF